MDNFLYISNTYPKKSYGGRQNLSISIEKILKKILKKRFYCFKIKRKKKNKLNLIFDAFQGKIDGVNSTNKFKIIDFIKKNNISYIFIDGSNLGLLCKYIKQFDNNIRILVFFHNTEVKFFFDSFLINKTIHSLGVMIANYFAERNSCNYSDEIIALTKKDMIQINKIYKKKTNYIFPLFVKDLLKKNVSKNYKFNLQKKYILFVGSAFYANLNGIIWFVKKVLPKIKINLAIVGYGFEKYKNFLKNEKIIFLGKSKNINKWYKKSNFVVSPIFLGSGMKNKVAEAIMFGKKIVGTSETFVGYESIKGKIGYECNDEKIFIKTINNLVKSKEIYSSKIRHLYKKNFSFEASFIKMKDIIEKFEKNKYL